MPFFRCTAKSVCLPAVILASSVLAVFLIAVPAFSEDSSPSATTQNAAKKHELVIHILNESQWNSGRADVEKVLYSTASTLWGYFPERTVPPILVAAQGGPITLFKRGPNGEINVLLNTGNRLWAQHAFQFAHEFGHILCNYNKNDHRNRWFEESLCEVASLFVLRRMAQTWVKQAPYPNWSSYAPHLRTYADERLTPAQLPPGTTLAQWYAENAADLTANPVDRDRNTRVATVLLGHFEATPESWEAVSWLNTERLTRLYSFSDYLAAWQRHCPERHKAFVASLANEFGIILKPDGTDKIEAGNDKDAKK